jgi:PadR family transcriptional regulator, regulatory protein PadR
VTRLRILQGTLDLTVLQILSSEPLHGYAISQRVQEASDGRLLLEEGSLYPALYRMEKKGWVSSEWQKSESGRRARVYSLTADGRTHLAAEKANWQGVSEVMERLLER